MGILFENIEDANIKGGPQELGVIISKMDLCLQDIADKTNKMSNVFQQLSANLKGRQFEKAVESVSLLSKYLQNCVEKMNGMQRSVADYQNRLSRFEGLSEDASYNEIDITPVQTSVETAEVSFSAEQWVQVYNGICTYCASITESLQRLVHDKNETGEIWNDSQYDVFSDFIDTAVVEIESKVKILEEYSQHLKEELAGLGISV